MASALPNPLKFFHRSSMSSSSSSSSSRSPSPLVSQKSSKKSLKKPKTSKEKGKAVNRKDDPSWEYKPPTGYSILDNAGVDAGVFDWDKVQADDDTEIWIIRVPKNVIILSVRPASKLIPETDQPQAS